MFVKVWHRFVYINYKNIGIKCITQKYWSLNRKMLGIKYKQRFYNLFCLLKK